MARSATVRPRGLVWLAAFLLLQGAVRVAFGLAAVTSGSPSGVVTVVVGVILLLAASGIGWTRPWGWWLGVGILVIDPIGSLVLFVLMPSALIFALAIGFLDFALLLYLLGNRRHFKRRPVPGDPLPVERKGRFEERF